ncbi:S41 family peptidase [Saccharibacillus sp. O23]|uniref:S41 family peptidase n=1 Tax=Saccharibacillus sp. O23 TaxID=2009338 RepID=UPI0015C6256C|nr:S41 family peptidase [Saccharibacillus sp. O23]
MSEQKIDELAKLGKVWGLMKYHHPKFISSEANGDEEFFRTLHKILEDHADVNAILYDWVKALDTEIVPEELQAPYRVLASSVQRSPNTGWVKDRQDLGGKLSLELSKLLTAHITEREGAYVSFKNASGYFDMGRERPYYQMKFDDTGYRLLGLFRYWNIIEYYYPYKNQNGEDWDQVLREFIPKIIAGDDYDSYFKTLAELTARVHDSHVNLVGEKRKDVASTFGKYQLPVSFVEIDGRIVIDQVFGDCGLKLGDIVLKIDGVDIQEIAKNRRTYISQSREDTSPVFFRSLLRIDQRNASVAVNRRGKEIVVRASGFAYASEFQISTPSQVMENGDIYYMNAGKMQDAEVDRIMKEHRNTKGLIVDLRNHPKTELSYVLAEYLVSSPTEFALFSMPNRAIPGEFDYTQPEVSGRTANTDHDLYQGKVVLLINEHTISNGETVAMSLRNGKNVVLLGRPTAGANGDVVEFSLPGNIKTRISGFGVFDPEKGPIQGVGVQPDIYLQPTVEGIVQGKDEYIEKAIELIEEEAVFTR